MESIKRVLLLFLICYSSIATLTAQENNSFFLHTIEKGQNLYSISSMYGINKADIIRLNPGCEEKIYAGKTLKIPQQVSNKEQTEIFHTIQPGETLYKLTTMYKVSAKAITDENPGLSAENFKIGQVIRIPEKGAVAIEVLPEVIPQIQPEVKPKCKEMHKVKRKETIFSVSREYGITEQELKDANPELNKGMKKGQLLCIPYPQNKEEKQQQVITPPTDKELFKNTKEAAEKIQTIKAAVILPFLSGSKSDASKMVEYYEGFLLAVDSLKRQKVSMDIYTYNSGDENSSIAPILAKEELKNMDVIFGPLHQQHIKPLAEFADANNIRLVIPFSSKDNEVFQNPNIFQINTPQSYLYSEVYDHFTKQFPNSNVIILGGLAEEKDKVEFIAGLETELKKKNILVQTVNGNISSATLKSFLQTDKVNIFIPTSGSDLALIKLIPQLKLLIRENPGHKIHLFGYPEWQVYTKDHLESFFELDTYFYSSFYTNNLLPSAINFINNYHKWYTKEMMNIYPKYGMLGFDTGYYFLSGLAKYGTGFEENLLKTDIVPIQTGFKFERVNNWGGFINKKVFFVHFTKDFEPIKLDFE
ncbi:LysM peptidoglycan-binding domain-containing protein [Bacteroides sp. 224]|uniref:LysM peptidoglycan-binding domain-containing protein n=1 Tax=Bacteroides sp. 224 TaxID=2302936 RepID=UPI0013D7C273|nr:LysM peptidoglycan-binding domain-containing protein [Bacteroides sp. 224]NDV66003.1 LysM peptidoglycan-binding domain-containing protein [Bacteroides sp. 224]